MRFLRVAGANHFLNDGPAEMLLEVLDGCIPAARPAPALQWPALPKFNWRKLLPVFHGEGQAA